MKGPALSTLRRFLACIPNIRILDLDINVTLRISNIVEVDDTLLPNTVFQKLESLSLKTNLRGTEVCSDDFIARQPSLIELRDLLSSRQLIGTSPMLQGLCFRRAFQLPDVPSLESLRSLTNLRLSITGFPSNVWGRLASDLPLLSCVEVCVFLENASDGDEAACRVLSEFSNGHITEFGLLFEVANNRSSKKNCTSLKHLVIIVLNISLNGALMTIYHLQGRLAISLSHSMHRPSFPHCLHSVRSRQKDERI